MEAKYLLKYSVEKLVRETLHRHMKQLLKGDVSSLMEEAKAHPMTAMVKDEEDARLFRKYLVKFAIRESLRISPSELNSN